MTILDKANADQMRTKIDFATCDSEEFTEAMHRYLSWLSECLSAPSAETMAVCLEIAYLLHDYPTNDEIWAFLRTHAAKADASLRECFRIAFLELIPEEPVDIQMLERMWANASEPSTCWMVEAAYNGDHKTIGLDHARIQVFRREQGMEPLPELGALRKTCEQPEGKKEATQQKE